MKLHAMKKSIAVLLALVMLVFSGTFINAFSADDNLDYVFEGEQYLSEECVALLNGDIESVDGEPAVYDLFSLYQANQLADNTLDGVKFASKDGQEPMHQRICAEALAILAHDIGDSVFNSNYNFSVRTTTQKTSTYNETSEKYSTVTVSTDYVVDNITGNTYNMASTTKTTTTTDDQTGTSTTTENYVGNYNNFIIKHSETPDTDSAEIGTVFIFLGHFYDPYTEKNYNGATTGTAKTNAAQRYSQAKDLYDSNGGNPYLVYQAMEKIGRGVHYTSDACEPHHASNETGLNDYLGGKYKHQAYETATDTYFRRYSGVVYASQMDNYLASNDSPFKAKRENSSANVFDDSVYGEALKLSVGDIVRNNSYCSRSLIEKTVYTSSADYNDSMTAIYKNAVFSATQYLYKFAIDEHLFD